MRTLPKVLALGFMLVLASACVAPPPGPEQATAIAKVAESRATEAAAAEKIAAAKATEAAAGQQIAQLTAEAVASAAITTTATHYQHDSCHQHRCLVAYRPGVADAD